jgi:hypothetical protein
VVGARLWAGLAVSFALLVPYLALTYRTSLLESLVVPFGGAIMIAILVGTMWLRERLKG